jgi:hypothetical protein
MVRNVQTGIRAAGPSPLSAPRHPAAPSTLPRPSFYPNYGSPAVGAGLFGGGGTGRKRGGGEADKIVRDLAIYTTAARGQKRRRETVGGHPTLFLRACLHQHPNPKPRPKPQLQTPTQPRPRPHKKWPPQQ